MLYAFTGAADGANAFALVIRDAAETFTELPMAVAT